MIRSTPFPTLYNSAPILSHAPTCHSLPPARAVHSHSSLLSRFVFPQFRQCSVKLSGGGFVVAAEKKQRRGGAELAKTEDGFDEEEFDDEYDGEEEEEEEEELDDEEMLPLEKMNKWFEKKPKGFGEGKVYDTSVEDKLLEEIRQSRIAQAENLKRLKSNPVKHASNEIHQKKNDAELVPVGGRVRLENLPKKKNIHRDLKSALQGIPGIINIVPAVTGNKKTRDPICKGFAFIDFKRKEDAVRFVELYSGQTITFGKIQKQLKCELLNAQSSSSLKLNEKLISSPQLMISAFEEDSNEESNIVDDSAISSWDETNSDDLDDLENQMDGEEQEADEDNQESVTALRVDCDDSTEMGIDPDIDLLPSEQRNATVEPKSSVKVKQENPPKKKPTSKGKAKQVLDVPGSARRLKIREKAVLSDVFSKYGLKATLASKDN